MEVGMRIVELRHQRGITTNKLANLCGLSQSFVRSVEIGEKNISVENLTLICDALHVSLKDFFDCPVEGTLLRMMNCKASFRGCRRDRRGRCLSLLRR